jgi:hypothetical protein
MALRMMYLWLLLVAALLGPPGYAQDGTAPVGDGAPAAAPAAKPRNVVITWDPANREVTELIPLQSLTYAEVEQHCRPLLSPVGTLGNMPERGSVIVHDHQKNVNQIRAMIKALDRPAVNVRVEIDFMNTGRDAQDSLNVRLSRPGDPAVGNNLVFRDGKWVRPTEVRVNASRNRGSTTRNTSQFIMTMSGHPATLWVGKTIPDPSWLNNVRFTPTVVIMGGGGAVIIPGNDPEWVWRDVGARLMVLPYYRDNGLIDVEIYPEVTYLDGKGRHQAIRTESVSTRLTVQNGQRISIGGVVNDNREFYTNLFGPQLLSRDDSTSVLDMYLTCHVMVPRDPAAQAPVGIRDIPAEENPWRRRH